MKLAVAEHGKYSPDGTRMSSVIVLSFASREQGVTVDFETEYQGEQDPALVVSALRMLASNIEARFLKKA